MKFNALSKGRAVDLIHPMGAGKPDWWITCLKVFPSRPS